MEERKAKFIENARKVHGDKYDYSLVEYVNIRTKVSIVCPVHGEFKQQPINHTTEKNGCPQCSRKHRIVLQTHTTIDFISKARTIHASRYDYSLVEYQGTNIKVKIICRIHGEFQQTPNSHINNKCGCPKCAGLCFSSEDFITKARVLHGDKYDYSKVNYIRYDEKVIILCKIHGEFLQTPGVHLKPCGCKTCSTIQRKQTCQLKYGGPSPSHSALVQRKQKQTCLERYGVEYAIQSPSTMKKKKQTTIKRYGVEHAMQNIDIQEKLKQTCINIYGVDNIRKSDTFKQKVKQTCLDKRGVSHHLQTDDCMQKLRDTNKERYGVEYAGQVDDFKEKTNATNLEKYGTERPAQRHLLEVLHLLDDAVWLDNQYTIRGKTSVEIANDLNTTSFTVLNYLHKHGIVVKQQFNASRTCVQWLESIMNSENVYIQHGENGGEFSFNPSDKKQKADGYCAETNTIYEFHGDYWHGNPTLYESNFVNSVNYKTMGELYQKTIERENKIKSLGYNLVVMWENDWNKLNKKINTIST